MNTRNDVGSTWTCTNCRAGWAGACASSVGTSPPADTVITARKATTGTLLSPWRTVKRVKVGNYFASIALDIKAAMTMIIIRRCNKTETAVKDNFAQWFYEFIAPYKTVLPYPDKRPVFTRTLPNNITVYFISTRSKKKKEEKPDPKPKKISK